MIGRCLASGASSFAIQLPSHHLHPPIPSSLWFHSVGGWVSSCPHHECIHHTNIPFIIKLVTAVYLYPSFQYVGVRTCTSHYATQVHMHHPCEIPPLIKFPPKSATTTPSIAEIPCRTPPSHPSPCIPIPQMRTHLTCYILQNP